MAPRAKRHYRVLVGMNYGPNGAIRREPGDVVDDFPPDSVAAHLELGYIELAEPPKKGGA